MQDENDDLGEEMDEIEKRLASLNNEGNVGNISETSPISEFLYQMAKSNTKACMFVSGTDHVVVVGSDGERVIGDEMPISLYKPFVENMKLITRFDKPNTGYRCNSGSITVIFRSLNCKVRFDMFLIPGPNQKTLVFSVNKWSLT